MQQPLQITFHEVDHSDAIEANIRARAAELERFYDRITSCHATVELANKRHHKGNLYRVRLEIHVPGKVIAVGHVRMNDHAHEDVYVAIRDAFSAATRQLEDYVRTRRGRTKHHEVPDHGTVARVFPDLGYGFVQRADGMEVYFHEHACVNGSFGALAVGDAVRIVVADDESDKGPQASSVIPLGKRRLVGEAAS